MEASEKTVVSIDERRTANSQFETCFSRQAERQSGERQEINRPQNPARKGVRPKERHQARVIHPVLARLYVPGGIQGGL